LYFLDGVPTDKNKRQKTPPPKTKTEERGARQEDRGAQTAKQQAHGGGEKRNRIMLAEGIGFILMTKPAEPESDRSQSGLSIN